MSPRPAFGKFRLDRREADDVVSPKTRKRNRKILSCVACHRSKVKCDRGAPCKRCVQAGRGDQCLYAVKSPSQGEAESRHRTPSRPGEMSYAGYGSMTTGLTHWSQLIGELGEVQRYIFNQDADFHGTFSRVTAIKELYPIQFSHNFPFGDYCPGSSGMPQRAILEHLPPRALLLGLVDNYLGTFDKTHKLLHPPQFEKEIAAFLADPQAMPLTWLGQLFMMLALSIKSAPPHLLNNLNNLETCFKPAQLCQNLLSWAEVCLKRSSYMDFPDLSSIRTLCMMAIAKGLDVETPAHSKGLVALVGFIVRLAMSIALHRDQSTHGVASSFDAEMQRRIWNTIVYIDLDAAIVGGVPPSIRPDDFDTAIPFNLDDDKLRMCRAADQTHSDLMALAQPRRTWTDSSFQIRLAESYPMVTLVVSVVNSTNPKMGVSAVEESDKKLRSLLRDTNLMFTHLLSVSPDREPILILQQTMFEVFIRRTLLALHQACARYAQGTAVPELSHVSILECSLALLYAQQTLQDKRERMPSMLWFADLNQSDFAVAMLHIIKGLRRNQFPDLEPVDQAQQQQSVPQVQARETTLTALRASYEILKASVGRSFYLFKIYFGLTLALAAFEASERGEVLPEAMQRAATTVIEVARRSRQAARCNEARSSKKASA